MNRLSFPVCFFGLVLGAGVAIFAAVLLRERGADHIPPMDELGQGRLSAKGMAEFFQDVCGLPMPPETIPRHSRYTVHNEKDYGGRNRRWLEAVYTAPPEAARKLVEHLRNHWKMTYCQGTNRFIMEAESTQAVVVPGDPPIRWTPGSKVVQVHDPDASYVEKELQAVIDPNTGTIKLSCYTGTKDR